MARQLMFDATKPGVLIINGKRFHGKTFQVEGIELELYPIQALANAVGRRVESVRLWEKRGELPKPLFRVLGANQEQRRWYSRTQIINIHQAFNRFPFNRGRAFGDHPHMRAAFFALVHRVFDEGEVLNVGDIEVTIRPGRPETQSISSPSSRSSQPQGYWEMAEVSLAESSTSSATAKDDNRAHQSEIDPAQKGGGYSASSHPRPDAKRTDYRRRPASRA